MGEGRVDGTRRLIGVGDPGSGMGCLPSPLFPSLEPNSLGRGAALETYLAKKPKVQVSWSMRWGQAVTQEVGLRRAEGVGRESRGRGARAHVWLG